MSGELFPCAASSCGCRTADQCWRSCCCHSLAERIAWARQHGVRPPEFALAQAKAAGLNVSCCVATKSTTPSCCETRLVATKKVVRACCSQRDDVPAEEPTGARVIGWQSLKCNGHSMNWLAAVPMLIGSQNDSLVTLPPTAWIAPTTSETAAGTSLLPAVPPPERA